MHTQVCSSQPSTVLSYHDSTVKYYWVVCLTTWGGQRPWLCHEGEEEMWKMWTVKKNSFRNTAGPHQHTWTQQGLRVGQQAGKIRQRLKGRGYETHGKTKSKRRVGRRGEEERVLLANKREWFKNICNGFKGKSARKARSTCCSPLHHLLFLHTHIHTNSLSLTPFLSAQRHLPFFLSFFFLFTYMIHIAVQLTCSQELYFFSHDHLAALTWCANLAHRLWQSESVSLFLNLLTRLRDGKTLTITHTSSSSYCGSCLPKPAVWAQRGSLLKWSRKAKEGVVVSSCSVFHHNTCKKSNWKCSHHERRRLLRADQTTQTLSCDWTTSI